MPLSSAPCLLPVWSRTGSSAAEPQISGKILFPSTSHASFNMSLGDKEVLRIVTGGGMHREGHWISQRETLI